MIQRLEQFASAIFEISRSWHRLGELPVYGLKALYAVRRAGPLYPVLRPMDEGGRS